MRAFLLDDEREKKRLGKRERRNENSETRSVTDKTREREKRWGRRKT